MATAPAAVVPRVLLDDEQFIVVDKPAGMPSVPARTPLDPPDVASELFRAGLIASPSGFPGAEAVHRLDRDTSGVLVLARTRAARAALGRAFETRAVAKLYLAVVHGPIGPTGIVDLPLADDPLRPPRKRVDPTFGRRATTRWMRMATIADSAAARSLIALEPWTGRSHQLRVHLAWIGAPIVGDRLYGPPRHGVTTPLALHAAALEFPHPADGRRVRVTAPVPEASPWRAFAPISLPAWGGAPSD